MAKRNAILSQPGLNVVLSHTTKSVTDLMASTNHG